jgi:hypothetical protein
MEITTLAGLKNPLRAKDTIEESDIHRVVGFGKSPNETATELSYFPKFVPNIDTKISPVAGAFRGSKFETMGL